MEEKIEKVESSVVVLYSGGLDSTVLLYKCLKDYDKIYPVNVHYGSRHNTSEREAAMQIISALNIPMHLIDIPHVFANSNSSLIRNNDIAIPEGHYEDETMKSTVVPFRNGIMLSLAISYAESIGAGYVAIANHFGDHAIYPDCRSSFIEGMKVAAREGTYNKIHLISPFCQITKANIVEIGIELNVPFEKTWSCYKGKKFHCGVCGTCVERIEAFELAKIADPTIYQNK